MSSKNITFLITSLNGGGAERQLQSIACGLKNRGWEVSVIAMIYPDNPAVSEALKKAGIPIYYLGMQRGKAQISAIFRLASLICKLRPDIIHSHMVHANILARVTRMFCGIPRLICTAHSTVEGGIYLKLLYKITDFMADYTTQVSKFAAEKYVNEGIVSAKRMRYIPNGISTKIFSFSEEARRKVRSNMEIENRFVWITVARLEPPKDFFTLLSAFKDYCGNDSILLLVGDGKQRQEIEKKASEYKLEKRVKFLGFRYDIPDLMSASDAFVLSSLWEGLPLVVGEAMSIGLPAVSANNGGQIEFVLENKTGFLVPPRDIKILGERMSEIEKMSNYQREQFSHSAIEHAKNYDIEKVLDTWEKAYTGDL